MKNIVIIHIISVALFGCNNSPKSINKEKLPDVDCSQIIRKSSELIKNYSIFDNDQSRLDSALVILNESSNCDKKGRYIIAQKKLMVLSILKDYKAALIVIDTLLNFKSKDPRFLGVKGALFDVSNRPDSAHIYYEKASAESDTLLLKNPTNITLIYYKISLTAITKGKEVAEVELDDYIVKTSRNEILLQLKNELAHFNKDSLLLWHW